MGERPVAEYPDERRRPRPRRGPLAGVRVTDFCWMGVGVGGHPAAGRLRRRGHQDRGPQPLDMPRRLPLYKDERARTYGEEDAEPRSEQGRAVQQLQPQQAGRHASTCATAEGRAAGRAAHRHRAPSSRENFAPGVMERWGLTYEHLRAASRRHLRPHERFRTLRAARQLPQLRAGGPGGLRPLAHQRPARPGAVRLGAVLHGQPGGVLQLGRHPHGDLPPEPDRGGHRDRRLRGRGGHRPARVRSCSTSLSTAASRARPDFPDRQPARVPLRRAARGVPVPRRRSLGGHRRLRRRRVAPRCVRGHRAIRLGRRSRGSPPRRPGSPTRTRSTSICRVDRQP